MHVAEFWELTIGQFSRYIDGYKDRLDREAKQQDQLNYWLGNYIGYAVNNPKKYPKEPLLSQDEKQVIRFTTDKQRIMAVRAKYGKKK